MQSFRYALITSIVLTMMAGSFLSCSDPISSDPEPEAPATIRPLTIGNQWFGTQTRFNKAGPTEIVRTITRVADDTLLANIPWFRIDHMYDDTSLFAYQYSMFSRNDSVGNWETFGTDVNLLAKYPALVLDSFAYDMGDTIVQIVVTSVDTKLTVPAGEFSCYNYRYSIPGDWGGEDSQVSYFLSPGVGMIRSEYYGTSSASDTAIYLRSLWELDSLVLVEPR